MRKDRFKEKGEEAKERKGVNDETEIERNKGRTKRKKVD